jgi:uncharacterized protein (DUF1778 family)
MSSLMVRLDEESKAYLAKAAELRRTTISEYVRSVTVAHAKREVEAANAGVIALTAEEQLAFWNALQQPVKLTPAQRKLARLMRGEK